ncbi:MAG: hypothetical protein AB7O73_08540 [Bacteroidia bacterium]
MKSRINIFFSVTIFLILFAFSITCFLFSNNKGNANANLKKKQSLELPSNNKMIESEDEKSILPQFNIIGIINKVLPN